MNLLIIEDDEIVAKTIERSLRGNDFSFQIAGNGLDGLKLTQLTKPDLVILDIMMPGMDGYSVCKEIRSNRATADIPILFLTAKINDADRIAGFLAGADDYLTKPFNIDELELRIRAILRRVNQQKYLKQQKTNLENTSESTKLSTSNVKQTGKSKKEIRIGDFTLDILGYELATPDRGKIRLTPVQFDLLFHLMTHPGEIFTPARLLDEVWNYPPDTGSPDLVRMHIKNLREKIEKEPRKPDFVQTVTGFGYTVRRSDKYE